MLLDVKNVVVCYDTAVVLDGVSLNVDRGELVGLVGPNGAGKTTLMRSISGLMNCEKEITRGTRAGKITYEGSIVFDGEEISQLPAHKIAEKGLILCPERGRPFIELTVYENLLAAAYLVKDRREVKQKLEKVYELFPRLKERHKQVSGTLSGGERQMLAVGRGLMYSPKLLLVDEPSSGLAPKLKDELFTKVGEIFGLGVTILLAEQDISFAFALSGRNYVMSKGHVIAEGTDKELLADEKIRKTYLGV